MANNQSPYDRYGQIGAGVQTNPATGSMGQRMYQQLGLGNVPGNFVRPQTGPPPLSAKEKLRLLMLQKQQQREASLNDAAYLEKLKAGTLGRVPYTPSAQPSTPMLSDAEYLEKLKAGTLGRDPYTPLSTGPYVSPFDTRNNARPVTPSYSQSLEEAPPQPPERQARPTDPRNNARPITPSYSQSLEEAPPESEFSTAQALEDLLRGAAGTIFQDKPQLSSEYADAYDSLGKRAAEDLLPNDIPLRFRSPQEIGERVGADARAAGQGLRSLGETAMEGLQGGAQIAGQGLSDFYQGMTGGALNSQDQALKDLLLQAATSAVAGDQTVPYGANPRQQQQLPGSYSQGITSPSDLPPEAALQQAIQAQVEPGPVAGGQPAQPVQQAQQVDPTATTLSDWEAFQAMQPEPGVGEIDGFYKGMSLPGGPPRSPAELEQIRDYQQTISDTNRGAKINTIKGDRQRTLQYNEPAQRWEPRTPVLTPRSIGPVLGRLSDAEQNQNYAEANRQTASQLKGDQAATRRDAMRNFSIGLNGMATDDGIIPGAQSFDDVEQSFLNATVGADAEMRKDMAHMASVYMMSNKQIFDEFMASSEPKADQLWNRFSKEDKALMDRQYKSNRPKTPDSGFFFNRTQGQPIPSQRQ